MNDSRNRSAPHADPARFGRALKHWRRLRGASQLGLALSARVSARHLSFIEGGRSRASREMVLILARALRLPLREQNDLLEAAGYARLFPESSLDAPDLGPARQALRLLLEHQEPFPAVVLDRRWNLGEINGGARRLFGWLLGPASRQQNLVRAIFDPAGLRPVLENWDEVAASILQRVRSEAVAGIVDPETERLLAEVSALSDLPDAVLRLAHGPASPILPVTFAKDGVRLSFFSAITTLGTPRDVTLQELRLEHFFPADEETRREFVRRFRPGAPADPAE